MASTVESPRLRPSQRLEAALTNGFVQHGVRAVQVALIHEMHQRPQRQLGCDVVPVCDIDVWDTATPAVTRVPRGPVRAMRASREMT